MVTKDKPTFLLLDLRQLYLSVILLLGLANEDGVMMMLSFLAHATHKLQVLDMRIYAHVKRFVNRAFESWLRNFPEKNISQEPIHSKPASAKCSSYKILTNLYYC
jgi:hypothetical protein